MTKRPRLLYAPPETLREPWCVPDPLALKEESDNNEFYPYFTAHGITITATPTTFTITDPQLACTSGVHMEATMDSNGIYWGNVWILPVVCAEPSMTILALTIHRSLNPPDVSEEILFYGAHGNWMNFLRFLYSVSDTWVREHAT